MHMKKKYISSNLEVIREKMREASILSGRSPEDVTLLAVSKRHSAELVAEGVLCGITNIGENRFQEADEKIPRVKKYLKSDTAALRKI